MILILSVVLFMLFYVFSVLCLFGMLLLKDFIDVVFVDGFCFVVVMVLVSV